MGLGEKTGGLLTTFNRASAFTAKTGSTNNRFGAPAFH